MKLIIFIIGLHVHLIQVLTVLNEKQHTDNKNTIFHIILLIELKLFYFLISQLKNPMLKYAFTVRIYNLIFNFINLNLSLKLQKKNLN